MCSVRFWGWSENKREEERDLEELSQGVREGKSLYGESPQPAWVQQAANRSSQWSQLKFGELLSSYSPHIPDCAILSSCIPNVRRFLTEH